MILTKSPYYITATSTGYDEMYLKIYRTTDTVTDILDYTLNKKPYGANTVDFEVSSMVGDYLEPSPIFSASTALLDSNDSSVVKYKLVYGDIDSDTIRGTIIDYATNGYGYYLEGENPGIPTNKILLSNDYFIVNKYGHFNIPILNDGTYTSYTIDGTSYSIPTATDVTDSIKNIFINLSDYNGVIDVVIGANTITLEIQEECKYTPVDIIFLNKFGAWQIMPFFKAKKEGLTIARTTFDNNTVTAGTYNTQKHQIKTLEVTANENVTLNSGFVPELTNEDVRQLLLSSSVYELNGGEFIPLNPSNTSYEYKTRINDKLINHSISFTYAFDLINKI